MISISTSYTNLRLLIPEVIYLEPEHLTWAKDISTHVSSEACQWQTYLNSLALLGFEQWLREHLPKQLIHRDSDVIEFLIILKVGEFKICLISTENMLDEVLSFPKEAIDNPKFAAHLYVAIEVSEEQEEIIIRGFIRCDRLLDYLNTSNPKIIQDGFYQLPLSEFDPEPNHLLFYCRFLEATSIPLPVVTAESTERKLDEYLEETRTKLSQWLQGVFDQGWQTIEALINPDKNLALNLRNADKSVKRGRLIDLGIQVGNENVALLVNVTQETEEKLRVLVQLHPTAGQRFLQPNIKLNLLSETGKILYEVSSRSQDNYIQLNAFKGELGKLFTVEVVLGDARVRENFEL